MPTASPPANSAYQVLDVVVEVLGPHLEGLPTGKRLEWLGQFVDRGQFGVADQNRRHRSATFQTCGHLAPHPILRVKETTTIVFFGG
jgi:hypothetical protein